MSYDLERLEQATGYSVRQMAAHLGFAHTENLYRLRRTGLSLDLAERYAIKLGRVPYEVWPEWLAESAELAWETEQQDRERADLGERERKAKNAERYRRLYRSNPAYREAQKAKRRRYSEESHDYVLGRQRRYHEANRERDNERSRLARLRMKGDVAEDARGTVKTRQSETDTGS